MINWQSIVLQSINLFTCYNYNKGKNKQTWFVCVSHVGPMEKCTSFLKSTEIQSERDLVAKSLYCSEYERKQNWIPPIPLPLLHLRFEVTNTEEIHEEAISLSSNQVKLTILYAFQQLKQLHLDPMQSLNGCRIFISSLLNGARVKYLYSSLYCAHSLYCARIQSCTQHGLRSTRVKTYSKL